MPLPSSGPMRMGADVNVELKFPATSQISLGSAGVRGLYKVPSGAIRLAADGYGKASSIDITTNQINLDLYTYATTNGYPGSGPVTVVIAPGVYVYANTTSSSGLTIPSAFGAGNLTLVNNGYIVGQGGKGGFFAIGGAYAQASPGGPAMRISTPIIFTNNGFVAGGGGGGAAGFVQTPSLLRVDAPGGGGAGGGTGGEAITPSGRTGGRAGNVGLQGGGGTVFPGNPAPGQLIPSPAPIPSAGQFPRTAEAGGAGDWRVDGNPSAILYIGGGGGGGYGAPGGTQGGGGTFPVGANGSGAGGGTNQPGTSAPLKPGATVNTSVGTGGKAIDLNGNIITYPATGTIWGTVS